ncbi:hypothetical protein Salat_0225500 [Sesamum alatum]|uniref:Uncharacterized protein n=1 Tax=Sesamum alatum TaxID=300844 RepID=A0AAE1YZ05_9LAMI|nr:hypothetical protein Salat_0225500 [Sesamum alatum]
MEYMLHVPVPPDDVHVPVPPDGADDVHEVIHIVSDTSSSTSSLARFIDAYYGTDSDADSVLPPPGVPSSIVKGKTPTPDKSPSNSSPGQVSSSASNATPVKKKD